MLEPHENDAVTRLVAAVLSVKPLVAALAVPVGVVPVAAGTVASGTGDPPGTWSAQRWDGLEELLGRIARAAGVPGLALVRSASADDLQVFERVISERLALADVPDTVAARPARADRLVAAAVAGGFDASFGKDTVVAHDGVPLNVYGAGQGDEAVVLVPACGMPAALTETWMRFLARDHRVVTWESRGLFGPVPLIGDCAVDAATQAADLFAVMDHYRVPDAHVVGLCGGAVIALAAAAERPERITSLSLWHGAYHFGGGSPRTRFQDDLIELMTIAAESRAAARSLQTTFRQVALRTTPAETAHLVLYPYATPELFYRYCRLNGVIATTDVEPYLPRVAQPTLVVTSADDQTAHPQGSEQVARGLPYGRLRVEPHGDHSSLFHAGTALMRVATDFIAESRGAAPLSIDCPRFV
ncbi:hypothetical protein GCM10009677_48970 [Sphaerisporangium rubeum]|uniref:Pimeloyl-ACP methyl ester carboxylesterase n=1 Tax=Sphaerisporangium rubeum TaxID=321317 RepID=A0A7X0I965_9ACTN|nr:alpha/beta hydrolase [Sphaerisporangium rubeum]MBB6470932.1 pimeloyl-ACP methyl ester carboxylesterase [Sphaerisporangium rubeum]